MRRKYRSRLEVLRDILEAARGGSKKTRIMNLANLNPHSFRKYLDFSVDHGLLMPQDGAFLATPHADEVLAAITSVLEKTSDLEAALLDLEVAIGTAGLELGGNPSPSRIVAEAGGLRADAVRRARPSRAPRDARPRRRKWATPDAGSGL